MLKKIALGSIGLLFLVSPIAVSADTLTDLQSILQSLGRILSTMQAAVSASSQGAAIASAVPQETKVLVLLLDFQNVHPNPGVDSISADTLRPDVFGDANSVKSFFKTVSYGDVSMSGDVYGWFTLPASVPDSCVNSEQQIKDWMSEGNTIALQHGVDVNAYSRVVYAFPADANKVCYMGGQMIGSAGAGLPKRIDEFLTNIMPHELLHSFGGALPLAHGNSVSCGAKSIQARYLSQCETHEYGDVFDTLGINDSFEVNKEGSVPLFNSLNAPHRIAAGWMPEANVLSVATSGTYTINALDSGAGTLILKIKKPDSDAAYPDTTNDYYYVEYNPVEYTPGVTVPGAMIRIWDGNANHPTYAIDTTPQSCIVDPMKPDGCPANLKSDFSDGFLTDGKTFTDNNNLKIRQVSHTAISVSIYVDLSSVVVESPPLSADKAAYSGGDTVTVTWNNSGATYPKDWIGLVVNGGKWTSYTGSRATMWFYTGGAKSGTKTIIAPNTLSNPITGSTGTWQLGYFINDGYEEFARSGPISISYVPPPPAIITPDKQSYSKNETIVVNWSGMSQGAKDWIGLVVNNGQWADYTGPKKYMWFYTGGLSSGMKTVVAPPVAGSYQLGFFPDDGYTITTRSVPLNVGSSTVPTSISFDKPLYQGNDTITVSWNGFNDGNPKDWIGLVKENGSWTDFTESKAKMWFYTGGASRGTKTITAPNASGNYQLAYFVNDGYTERARSPHLTVNAVAATVSSDKPQYSGGDPISVSWNDPNVSSADKKYWTGIVAQGQAWGTIPNLGEDISWFWTGNISVGAKTLRAPGVSGAYQIAYFREDNPRVEITRSPAFNVTAAPPSVAVTTSAPTYAQGSLNITGAWTNNAGATLSDWIALVPTGTSWHNTDPTKSFWVWATTNTQTQGTISGQMQGPITLASSMPPGQYQLVYYMTQKDSAGNDNYIEKARTGTFTVTAVITPPPSVAVNVSAPSFTQGCPSIAGSWSNSAGASVSEWIAAVPAGTTWHSTDATKDFWVWASTNTKTQGSAGSSAGSVSLSCTLPAGLYQLVYYTSQQDSAGNYMEKARSPTFTVTATNNPPNVSISSSAPTFMSASAIAGTWTNVAGAVVGDWIAAVPISTAWHSTDATKDLWVWATTNTKTQGTIGGQTSLPITIQAGAPAGQYQLVYYTSQQDSAGNYIEKARSGAFNVQ